MNNYFWCFCLCRYYNRTYFRIQGKRPTCLERASYHANESWPDSVKLMKVLGKIGLNKLSSLHIPSWHSPPFTVSYFLSDILRTPDNGRNRNWETFYSFFFSRNSQRYHHWILKSMEKIFKEFCKDLPTMVEQWRKFCFLESVKRLLHSVNTSFFLFLIFSSFWKR